MPDFKTALTHLNNFVTVVKNWATQMHNIFFASAPADVTVKVINEDNTIGETTIKNYAKMQSEVEELKDSLRSWEETITSTVDGTILQVKDSDEVSHDIINYDDTRELLSLGNTDKEIKLNTSGTISMNQGADKNLVIKARRGSSDDSFAYLLQYEPTDNVLTLFGDGGINFYYNHKMQSFSSILSDIDDLNDHVTNWSEAVTANIQGTVLKGIDNNNVESSLVGNFETYTQYGSTSKDLKLRTKSAGNFIFDAVTGDIVFKSNADKSFITYDIDNNTLKLSGTDITFTYGSETISISSIISRLEALENA